MAKVSENDIIDKTQDWGLDESNDLPYSGRAVQKFIKDTFETKVGYLYYDTANNRYLAFSDEENKDAYVADPTLTELILGTFDAPFNYTAEINLTTPSYKAVFLGSTGNYIDFTFDVKNKQGASTGENVTVTYTFIRNATKVVVKEVRKYNDSVHFNIDKYLGEGTNTIIVGVTGQTTLAATTVAVTYQVVNLTLKDGMNISKAYNLSSGSQILEVPFTVSGYGTKVVEWYLDGQMLDFVKSEDEVVAVEATRTKYITLSNLQQGRHSLQIRAYTVINGENFYTDTLYRDVIVYTGANTDVILGVSVTIPRDFGLLGTSDTVKIYDMVQYVPYTLKFASYSPINAAITPVSISIDGEIKGTVSSINGVVNEFSIVSTTSGTKTLLLQAGNVSYEIPIEVAQTSMSIEEITNNLVLDFNALGKSNNSDDKNSWSYGDYTGTLTGFNWNNTSGWVDGRLEMNAGSSFAIDLAPLATSPTTTGKTIEIEWSTKNVTNDDAIICDLRGSNGVGILITATKVSMTSADGVVVETEYKSDENVRIGFVINKSSGSTNQRLSFIYANGIISRGEKWALTDNYISDKTLLFTATTEAELSLKSIRIYNAALTSEQMLNNFTLYRDTIEEMMEVYDRNDIYEEGTATFSPDKMMSRLPVMIVTGDIPTLENTSDKDTQIIVDIDYYNMQDTSKSFRMVGAAMRPQGTSSMGYPKKNFRIYTDKVDGTILYDADGNVVEDKLYSFKEGAQPVNCWCLKADYAESSGTHNTGIARLWNNALVNAQVDGQYVCRTGAQNAAIEAGYEYDVRTTIDGFPMLLFYRPSKNDSIIFIGKYNFNNDKSTESVFGFKGIPNFDNSRMQCWEVLNNGNALALFTTTNGFDTGWSEAFESRYPDTKTPNTADLKAFCQWMTTVTQEEFATEKWQHLNVYMMAAYWCYLMRHAAADQFVKNAMFTSEDGVHFYYILYDNDTINGLINTGRLRIEPTDDRQTVDDTGSYVFAGHDSRLWNMLENDQEFINIVSSVDNALYSAGISYANTIRIFDEEQADKWVESVYNQDAQYKYISPYVEKGIDNLFMLQGKRDLHRRWWLAKRFAIYDAKYVSGTYKSQAIEIKCINGTPSGQQFTITAGYPIDYGYGINNVPRSFGVSLNIGESHTFTTEEVVNLGDPIRIYGAPNIAEVDFSPMASKLAVVTIANVYDDALGTKLTKLILGKRGTTNLEVTEISGLKQAVSLEHLDVQGMTKIVSLDLSNHYYFKTLKAFGSGLASITFTKGAPVESLELPAAMRFLSLEQLPYLHADNISFENVSSLSGMSILSCPNITTDFDFVYNWVSNKTTENSRCTLILDRVDWSNVSGEQMLEIAQIGAAGGTISLKGKVVLTDVTEEQGNVFMQVFGNSVFEEGSEFYIDAPVSVSISGATSILEGNSTTYTAKVYPPNEGTIVYSLPTSRTGCTIDRNTGVLTTTETGAATSNIVVRATFTPTDASIGVLTKDLTVSVVKRRYPADINIEGDTNLLTNTRFTWSTDTDLDTVNGVYDIEWSLSGGITTYYDLNILADKSGCTCVKKSTPPDTTSGTLTVKLKKSDGSVVVSDSVTLSHAITWVNSVNIVGSANPLDNLTYQANVSPSSTTGIYKVEWSLSGNIASYFRVSAYTNSTCTLVNTATLVDTTTGSITITLKKSHNNEVIATHTLSLSVPFTWVNSGTISGDDIVYNSSTYTLNVSPNGTNGVYSVEWSLTGLTSYLELGANNNTTCVVSKHTDPDDLVSGGILTAKVKKAYDGTILFTLTKNVSVSVKPNIVVATYNVTSTTSSTQLLGNSFNGTIRSMNVDGVDVTPAKKYTFSTTGSHSVIFDIGGANMSNMFNSCSALTSLDLSSLDTSSVTNMSSMFRGLKLTSLDLSSFDTSSVTNMSSMFASCSALTSLDLSSLDTSSVTNMNNMFEYCSALTSLDLSSLDTSSVTNMNNMFNSCSALTSLDLSSLDTSSVTNMSYMFRGLKLTSLDVSSLDTSSVTNMSSMFSSSSFTSLDLSSLDTSSVTDMSNMFNSCSKLTSLDVSSFDTSSVTNMNGMFRGLELTSLDLSSFDTSSVTNMSYMFYISDKLTSLDLSSFVTSSVTNMSSMFEYCSALTSLDLSSFVTSSVTNMSRMFYSCGKLTSLTFGLMVAPTPTSNTFGDYTSNYTGRATYNQGINKLYVPQGATGYTDGYWGSILLNPDKCGFTLVETL